MDGLSANKRRARRRPERVLSAALVLVLLAGCSRRPATEDAPVAAARVGDQVILVREVEEELASRIERGALAPAPPVLLENMIERSLLVQKALEEGLDQDSEVRRAWENLLISSYKERHLRGATREAMVSEEDIAQRYAANPDRFSRSARARLAILSGKLAAGASADEREELISRMREAREKALALGEGDGPGFGAWAVDYTEDQATRNRGGDAGWLEEGVAYRWPEEIVKSGFALEVGGLSDVLTTASGVYLVRKSDERGATQIPLDQVRDQIRKEIRTEMIRDMETAFARSLREGVVIEIYPEALAKIETALPAQAAAAEDLPPAIP